MLRFPLGGLNITQGILPLRGNEALRTCLLRHWTGDWGDVDAEDKASNDADVDGEGRLLSAYHIEGEKIWIITEWDRSMTTILLPDEY